MTAENQASSDGEWSERGRCARAALEGTWDSLAEACFELSAQEWALPTDCPGWDVKDQLSHLIGIERFLMGEPVPPWGEPLGPHVRNDFAASNEPWIAVRRSVPGPEIRAEFMAVTRARLAQLDALGDAEWAASVWSPIGETPLAMFMEIRVFDSWTHEQDVRRALDRPGGSATAASAMAIGQAQAIMPRVVGKQAGCPDGTVARFEISGPGEDARSFTIAVEGHRARPVDGAVPATVTMSLSSLDFMRLACGRASAEEVEAAGAIGLEGDAASGQRILGAMAFTF